MHSSLPVPGALLLSRLLSCLSFPGLQQEAQSYGLCSRGPWCWSAGGSVTECQGLGNLETIESHSSLFWRPEAHAHPALASASEELPTPSPQAWREGQESSLEHLLYMHWFLSRGLHSHSLVPSQWPYHLVSIWWGSVLQYMH